MKKVTVFSDVTLLVMDIVLVILLTSVCAWVLLDSGPESCSKPWEWPLVCADFGGLAVAGDIACLCVLPRIFCTIIFSEDNIQLKRPFRKATVLPYKAFPYIYCGGYFHANIAGIGAPVFYIVFTRKWMSQDELSQLNQMGNSDEGFKIRYSEKTFDKLCEVLPSKACFNLRAAFPAPVREKIKNMKGKVFLG